MPTSWADSVLDAAAENSVATRGSSSSSYIASRPTRPSYVPPHIRNSRNRTPIPSVEPSASPASRHGFASSLPPYRSGKPGYYGGGAGRGRGGVWNGNHPFSGGLDRGRDQREVNPFDDDKVEDVGASAGQENNGINFDAYDDIPVETSGVDVPAPVNTFAEIDLGDALNQNIRRCKYVKPTPVQRYAIPISLAGRDLMACAQTGSGKTAAFCFPIISGIMGNPFIQRPRAARTVFPLALVLSPTRELSCQIHEEAKKFSFQTGVKVVVVYGGAPIHQQVLEQIEGESLV